METASQVFAEMAENYSVKASTELEDLENINNDNSQPGKMSPSTVENISDEESDFDGDMEQRVRVDLIQRFVEERLDKAIRGEAYEECYDESKYDNSQKYDTSPDHATLIRSQSTPSLGTDTNNNKMEATDEKIEKQSEKYRSHPTLSLTRRQTSYMAEHASLPSISPQEEARKRRDAHRNKTGVVKLPKIVDERDLDEGDDPFDQMDIQDEDKVLNVGTGFKPRRRESLANRYGELATDAEDEIQHDWILQEEERHQQKRMENRTDRFLLSLPDEDPLVAIESRMDEVRKMSKPRRDERYVLDRISPEQREKILKIANTPLSQLKKARRKGWKLVNKLQWGVQMVILMMRAMRNRRLYYSEKNQLAGGRGRLERTMDSVVKTYHQGIGRSSLGPELHLALTTQPEKRDQKAIKRIMWLMRACKAFKHLFPAEMEMEIARNVGYEKYDDARIIAYQGRSPDRFYYVISGRVSFLRQFKLSTGEVTKLMGSLTKGNTTDPEEMEAQWYREDYMVAKGHVEVLILDKSSYDYLSHKTAGPPIEFLRTLDLFQEFPVEMFKECLDAIEYKYYGHGKIIVKDSNRTPWLHIVKSGQVKIVRKQTVIDARMSNESKFTSPRIEELGCGKSFSHAGAMLGVQAKQKKVKYKLSLPQVGDSEGLVSNPFGNTIQASIHSINDVQEPPPMIYRNTSSKTSQRNGIDVRSPTLSSNNGFGNGSSPAENEDDTRESEDKFDDDMMSAMPTEMLTRKGRRGTVFPAINIAVRETSAKSYVDYKPHGLFLTRERTEHDPPNPIALTKKKEEPHRRAFVQLGLLNQGDIFGAADVLVMFAQKEGLDHLQPALASEAHGVSLLSDGAEIIKISKRFFLSHAGNNSMLKVETMYHEYITEEEAKRVLFDKETWDQYKDALWRRITAPVTPMASDR